MSNCLHTEPVAAAADVLLSSDKGFALHGCDVAKAITDEIAAQSSCRSRMRFSKYVRKQKTEWCIISSVTGGLGARSAGCGVQKWTSRV